MPQTVKTPRIYINMHEFMASQGVIQFYQLYRTIPYPQNNILSANQDYNISYPTELNQGGKSFIAFLNHNFHSSGVDLNFFDSYKEDIINSSGNFIDKDGFSIMKVEDTITRIQVDKESNLANIVYGIFYDFTSSPDLSVKLEYSYEGIKEITTKGGATLTNQFYNKPPYDWELGANVGNKYRKSGRKIWDISFSFVSSESVFPTNSALDNNDEPLTTTDTLLDSDSLQRVVHLLNGFQNSFIFSPDNTSTQQDNFAICKIEANSFRLTQKSYKIYHCRFKIKEVW